MPHKRNPSTYERKLVAKKAAESLKTQRSYSRKIVNENAYHDQLKRETVNILEQEEIIKQVIAIYPDAPPQAIPTVQDGFVLTIPNLYHLELFPEQTL